MNIPFQVGKLHTYPQKIINDSHAPLKVGEHLTHIVTLVTLVVILHIFMAILVQFVHFFVSYCDFSGHFARFYGYFIIQCVHFLSKLTLK